MTLARCGIRLPVARAGAAAGILLTAACSAQTIATTGPGSAVQRIDRSARFATLNRANNGAHLENYTEGLLRITTSGSNWAGDSGPDFDPFHGANGADRAFMFPNEGNQDWVTVQTTDAKRLFAVEFMYGNGWTTGDPWGQYPWGNHLGVLEWQTWRGNTMVSSGALGVSPLLEMGTIVGFYDAAGFDRLLLRCTIANSSPPDLQALAVDNVDVQLLSCYANCDGSSVAPVLNVNDFTCFLNRYAAGDSYANCDGSTIPPILNVNDFTCFINQYAAGCS